MVVALLGANAPNAARVFIASLVKARLPEPLLPEVLKKAVQLDGLLFLTVQDSLSDISKLQRQPKDYPKKFTNSD